MYGVHTLFELGIGHGTCYSVTQASAISDNIACIEYRPDSFLNQFQRVKSKNYEIPLTLQ